MLASIPRIPPRWYARIAVAALASLAIIVITGAAVRLTGSGLGCPDWPDCRGRILQTELSGHAAIEYGNRLFTGVVGVLAILASLGALVRRPFRRDLAALGILLPLGVVGQAVLGGLVVKRGLAPGYVMGHFGLSMLILAAALALAWRAWREPGERPRTEDRLLVWPVRALMAWAALVIFAGTAATGSGPHAGASGTGEAVPRLTFWGADTLNALIHWHGRMSTVLGLGAVATWWLLRRRGARRGVVRALTVVCLLVAAQGVVGAVQYELQLPSTLVWVHVVLATLTWLAIGWAVAAAGSLAPQRSTRRAGERVGSRRVSVEA